MTDEELIKQLRDQRDYKCDLAADRIQQLLKANKGLAQAWATVSVKREMTEAKLDKAVTALRDLVSTKGLIDQTEYNYKSIKRRRALLAELAEKKLSQYAELRVCTGKLQKMLAELEKTE